MCICFVLSFFKHIRAKVWGKNFTPSLNVHVDRFNPLCTLFFAWHFRSSQIYMYRKVPRKIKRNSWQTNSCKITHLNMQKLPSFFFVHLYFQIFISVQLWRSSAIFLSSHFWLFIKTDNRKNKDFMTFLKFLEKTGFLQNS